MSMLMPSEAAGAAVAQAGQALLLCIWRSARHAYPDRGPLSLLRRLRFGWRAWHTREQWRPLREAPADSPLGELVRARAGMVHLVAWPYLYNRWSVGERLATVQSHYHQLEQWPWLKVPLGGRLLLSQLALQDGPPMTLQVDRPPWFAQEGELALSLFDDDTRVYSVVFSFGMHAGRPAMLVGAIQGRSIPGINERYAELTRRLHGCRPRDLVVLALLAVAESLGFEQVHAVDNGSRHHQDPSALRRLELPSADYDEVWRDRGGVASGDGFFLLATGVADRPLDSVPSKKRAMYRRRYELLDHMRADIRRLGAANQPPAEILTAPVR